MACERDGGTEGSGGPWHVLLICACGMSMSMEVLVGGPTSQDRVCSMQLRTHADTHIEVSAEILGSHIIRKSFGQASATATVLDTESPSGCFRG